MDNQRRLANYTAQNARSGRSELTTAQLRQLRKRNPDRPYRQHFKREPLIDNQHLPTSRRGIRRFGTPLGRNELDKLFQRVLVPVKLRKDQEAAQAAEIERVVTASWPARAIKRARIRTGERNG